jgi:NADPH2:quinone reductase
MQAHTFQINANGGPEVLEWRVVDLGQPQGGEALIRQTAVGLNLIDTYHRSGIYPISLPSGLGSEAAGVVEAIGPAVTDIKAGDRVAYAGGALGAYAEARLLPAERLVLIPDGITDEQAAAVLLKGMTAWYLLHHSYPVKAGDVVLVHAAAGGVGLLLCQWARHLGVTVIGVVSTAAKADLARENGCQHIILSQESDIAARVRELTQGEGVAAAYDSSGRDTFYASLDSLRPHGVMVSYGNASGVPDPVSPLELSRRHSLYLTRPVLFDFISTRHALLAASKAVFDLVTAGILHVHIGQRYRLSDAAQAHTDIEARKTSGSTVLLP